MDGYVSPVKKSGIGRGILTKKALEKLESMRIGAKAYSSGNAPGSVKCTKGEQFGDAQPFSREFSYNLDVNANILEKEKEKNFQLEDCVFCNRPPKMIVCRACGDTLSGRVRAVCEHHPTVVHLMDIDCCPSCKGMNLKEFS